MALFCFPDLVGKLLRLCGLAGDRCLLAEKDQRDAVLEFGIVLLELLRGRQRQYAQLDFRPQVGFPLFGLQLDREGLVELVEREGSMVTFLSFFLR